MWARADIADTCIHQEIQFFPFCFDKHSFYFQGLFVAQYD